MGKSKKSNLLRLDLSDARQLSLSVWEKAAMKKALNAILFIAAGWALNTGTHSFEEAEGGGTLAKWIHLYEPVNTNTSFKKRLKFTETTSNRLYSVVNSLDATSSHCSSTTWSKCWLHISVLEEALSSASCDSTSNSLLNPLLEISSGRLKHLASVYLPKILSLIV